MYKALDWPLRICFSYTTASSLASFCPFCFSYQSCHHVKKYEGKDLLPCFALTINLPILLSRCLRLPRPPLTVKLMKTKLNRKCYFKKVWFSKSHWSLPVTQNIKKFFLHTFHIAIPILFWGFHRPSSFYFLGGLGGIAPSLWNSST